MGRYKPVGWRGESQRHSLARKGIKTNSKNNSYKVVGAEGDLQPRFDSRYSFYGKARVRDEGDKQILQSYSTDVAYIQDGKAYVNGIYSQTTLRHIKEFLKQNGFKAENSKQIMNDYGVKQ